MNAKDLMRAIQAEFPVRDSWEGEVPFRGYDGGYCGEKGEGHHEFLHNLLGSTAPVEVTGLGTFTKVTSDEDYNESGDIDLSLVFKFKPAVPQETLFDDYSEKTFRITANLDSWLGGPWNEDLHEVKQVEKTIIVWERA